MKCWICNRDTIQKKVKLRNGNAAKLEECDQCDFQFFNHDVEIKLANDELDASRLGSSGLLISEIHDDFPNGKKQSEGYIKQFIDDEDINQNILEIGCSWGYFLDSVKNYGAIPFGVEINKIRQEFVKDKLNISCFHDIAECMRLKKRFKKIFLFYTLEYIKKPKELLRKLLSILVPCGEIIIITPNLNDVIKDVYQNTAFHAFFYDYFSIAYYTPKAMKRLLDQIENPIEYSVKTEQGYSFINHILWFFLKKPTTTGIVGGDRFFDDIHKSIAKTDLGENLSNLLLEFNQKYKDAITDKEYGNRIIVKIKKKKVL